MLKFLFAHNMCKFGAQCKHSKNVLYRQLVETVMEGHENAKEAKKKLQEYKAKMVAEVNEESQELMKRALEEVRNSSSTY